MHDLVPYIGRLDRQRQVFEFNVEAVALDAGFFSANICKQLEDRKIFAVVGSRVASGQKKAYF